MPVGGALPPVTAGSLSVGITTRSFSGFLGGGGLRIVQCAARRAPRLSPRFVVPLGGGRPRRAGLLPPTLREVEAEQLLAEQHERVVADVALAVDLDEG